MLDRFSLAETVLQQSTAQFGFLGVSTGNVLGQVGPMAYYYGLFLDKITV